MEPFHIPSGLLNWLPSLPETEPANYGDTEARVKEKDGSLPDALCLTAFGLGPTPLGNRVPVLTSCADFLDAQAARRYDRPDHVSDLDRP